MSSTNLREWIEIVTEADDPRLVQLYDTLNAALDEYHALKDSMGPDAAHTKVALQKVKTARAAVEEFQAQPATPPNTEIPDSDVKSTYHHYKPRGGFTRDKIRKHLRSQSSLTSAGSLAKLYDATGKSAFAREIRRFDSPQEFADHLFFHGTGGYVSGGLKPGGVLPKGTTEFGGGYGEEYHVISLSKSKEQASNFTGSQGHGTVHPVIVRKGAKIIKMPNIEDASELEDILPQLWEKGIDAVAIGDWTSGHSEQELCVINPRAVIMGRGEGFAVFQKQKFAEPTEAEIAAVYDQAKNPPTPPESE